MSVSDLEEARNRTAAEQDAERADTARSVADRAEPVTVFSDDDQAVLFPAGSVAGDAKVTLKNIAPSGAARKYEAKMSNAAIPMTAGLVRYGDTLELLVTVEAGVVSEVPELAEADSSGKRKLKGVKDVQQFRCVYVQDASDLLSVDQVTELMEKAGVSSAKIAEVLGLPDAA